MQKLLFTLLSLVLLTYVGCGTKNNSEPEEPKLLEISVEQAFDSANWDKQVAIEGYVRLPFSMFVYSTTPLQLFERPNQREGRYLDVEMGMTDSSDAGIFKLPSNYTHKDIRILTEDGDTLRGGDRIRLIGVLQYRQGGTHQASGPVLRVDSIFPGKQQPKSFASLNPPKLDSNMLKDQNKKNYLVQAEGYFRIPSMMFGFKEYWLFLEGDFGKVGAYMTTGEGPNCLAPFPENYQESDFKVFDAQGKPIDFSKKVRIYGNFSGPDSLTSGDISAEQIEQIN